MKLHEKLKKLRKERKLTQKDLAENIGVNMSHLNRIENGKCQPSIDMLKKFSDFFGVSADYFLSNEEFPEVQIENKSLAERIKLIDELKEEDKQALIHIIDSLLTKKRISDLLVEPVS